MPNNLHYKKDTLFSTYFYRFENKKLALELKKYILSLKELSGIESNIAPTIKQNLVESKFDFFKTDEKVIDKKTTLVLPTDSKLFKKLTQ